MPSPRYLLGAGAASDGNIYAIGGYYFGTLATVEVYRPSTNTWSSKASLPTPRYSAGVVATRNGKIYVMGGYNDVNYLSTVEEYDIASDTWTTKASMPTARSDFGVAIGSNGMIYAIGGCDDNKPWYCKHYLNTVEEYDPRSNAWTTKVGMPTARMLLGVAAGTNGKLYAIGGKSAENPYLSTVEEYNPATDSWSAKIGMLAGRRSLGVVAGRNGRVYAIGGYRDPQGLGTVEEYDPATDSWTTKANMPTARWALGTASTTDGAIYVIGGDLPSATGVTEQAMVPLSNPASVNIDGPTTGNTESSYTFSANTWPVTATQPITYVWQATDQSTAVHVGGLTDTMNFTWSTLGVRTITVAASNDRGRVTGTHYINISAEASPTPTRTPTPTMTSTPTGTGTATVTPTPSNSANQATLQRRRVVLLKRLRPRLRLPER